MINGGSMSCWKIRVSK